MKTRFYSVGSENLILPKRLGRLVEIYGKPVKSMLEYDPSKVDDEWGKVGKIYYVEGKVQQKNFVGTIYCDREEAEKIRSKEEKNAIGTIMQEKGFKIKDFEEMKKKIEQLEKENEELKSLPPVEVETIHNEFDEPQNENLTENKKRGRSTW